MNINTNPRSLVKTLLLLSALGAVVYFGSGLASGVARKLP